MIHEDTRHLDIVSKQGAEDSGKYFRYMAEFVGFTEADAAMVHTTKPIIEKHLPEIVAKFYSHLLRYPPTRKYFIKADGSLDEAYVSLRMRHLTNFWLRTADGVFDDTYARYVDYVGRAHTARAADPDLYIAERYVIGQVGMVQHAVSEALTRELRDVDETLEFQAVEAWDKALMIVLEMLSRAYGNEREAETYATPVPVDGALVEQLAEAAVYREEHHDQAAETRAVEVASVADIPEGGRKIVRVDGLSIGIFHHKDRWSALRNSCIHRGGPVATGSLDGDVLTCPWHGFQYDVATGVCLIDPSAELDTYAVEIVDDKVIVRVPVAARAQVAEPPQEPKPMPESTSAPAPNEFRVADVPAGKATRVSVDGTDVAVFNVGGKFFATADACTHEGGPLSEGELDGTTITCPWHGSCFNVTTGAVVRKPARAPVQVFKVEVVGDVGRVSA